MAITVTADLTVISLCETADDWSDGSPDDSVVIQGTYALGDQLKATLGPICTYTFGSAQDMTGKHIYIWMCCAGTVDTKANGGYRIYVETDASNYGTWYVGGKDMHPAGGWICFIIDPASTPTTGSGTINVASITKVGVQLKTLTSVVGQANNVFWDACRYGTGLTITSGVSDQVGMEEIFAEDDNVSNKYGVVQKRAGIYIIQGLLTFGGTGSENIDFVDESQVIVFPSNESASDSFYGIKVLAGTGTVNFELGSKTAGGRGISGCLIKAVGTPKFDFTATDTDIDRLGLYGTTFYDADSIQLPPNAANREVIDCNFEKCGEVLADTCVITYSNFINADDRAVRIADLLNHNITKCNFISCVHGVHCNVAGNVDFDELMFSGNTYDVEFSVSGTLNVSKLNGSNPSTEDSPLGDVNFLLSVTLKVIVKDETGSPIENAQVAIYRQSNMDELMNEDTLATGIAEETFDYGAGPDVDIYLRIRKSSTGATKYVPISTIGTITTDGFTYYAVLIEDSLA